MSDVGAAERALVWQVLNMAERELRSVPALSKSMPAGVPSAVKAAIKEIDLAIQLLKDAR